MFNIALKAAGVLALAAATGVAALAGMASVAGKAKASCLGVSRTVNISSFQTHMGASPSGGIGLRHKEVVLTFDDGPVPGRTDRILNALSDECTRATFFMVGRNARAYPGMVRKVARAGHTIAHHTDHHGNLPSMSISAATGQIQRGVSQVNRALGPMKNRSSRLFRYPYLARSSALDQVLRENRLLPFSAYIDSHDWKSISPAAMVNRVMSLLNSHGRGVILLHDIQGRTASALPSLLDRLKAGGYKVVHVRAGNVATPIIASSAPSSSVRKKVASRRNVDRTVTGSTKKKVTKRSATRKKSVARTVAKKEKKTLFGSLFGTSDKKARTSKSAVKRVKKTSAYSRPSSKRANRKSTRNASGKRSTFSLFPNAVKRRKGESTASYHHRVKMARQDRDR